MTRISHNTGRWVKLVGIVGFATVLGGFALADTSQTGSRMDSVRASQSNWVRVDFSDLNIDSQAGADRLMRRIRHAAGQVCPDPWSGQLKFRMNGSRCIRAATNRAVVAVNHNRLSDTHLAMHKWAKIERAVTFAQVDEASITLWLRRQG